MREVLSIIMEHFHEKRWILLMFGILMGLFGLMMNGVADVLDISAYSELFEGFPPEIIDFLGGSAIFTSPYAFLTVELFSFMWLFVGIFMIYVASSTAVPAEVENKTIDLILSKPISRESYLAGKIGFFYLYITSFVSIVVAFLFLGMSTSQTFIEFGLDWNRLLAVYLLNILHLGTLVMTTLLFATIFLNSKRTMGAGLATMLVMYFVGSFWQFLPEAQQFIKYASTWFYYNTMEVFGLGMFDDLVRNVIVLIGVNVVLIVASLLVFRRRDIPV
jgi:ABC-2 type transport system permease protein